MALGEVSQGSPVADPGRGPLEGILVADFSRVLAGPYCTMLLADLGAEVVKVESPQGDDTRTWKPPVRAGVSTYYLAINRNKRSIALDLGADEDRALAWELSRRADVMIENFKPGGLRRFGLDFASVHARNPRNVYCSISGFGTEAGAALPGYDLLVQAVSGLMSLTGEPDGPPLRAGISVFDIMTGLHCAVGILAALHHREASGEGQHIETNLLSVAMSTLVNQASAYVAGGVVPQRMGNAHLSLFPYEPLAAADGEIIVIAGNNGQFRKLCEVLGLDGLADDPRFATVELRNDNRDELRPILLERLSTRKAAEWFDALNAVGVPSGPINTVAGGVALAESLGLEPVVVVGEGAEAVPTLANPLRLSASPVSYRLPPPALDADRDELRTWLRSESLRPGPDQRESLR